jgi:multidrug efflux pump subunit AcrA (membrane-fusion protein)
MNNANEVVPNGSSELRPGTNCDVILGLAAPIRVARVPTSALVFDAGGPHVATVGRRGHVHFVPVRPGRLLGGDVEIVDGLAAGERVLSAPSADVTDGMLVKPALQL